MKSLIIAVLTLLAVSPTLTQSRQAVPGLTLRVGVRQKEDGKLDKGIHILTLQCGGGQCSLTSVSLNQCSTSPLGKPTFPAVVQVSSTRAGTLSVTKSGNVLKVEEKFDDIGGSGTNTFLFAYEIKGTPLLTSFSGGFTKHSVILNRVVTVEYIPFQYMMQAVPLDCPILVPGIGDKLP